MAGKRDKKTAHGFLPALMLLFICSGAFGQNERTAKVNDLYRNLLEYKVECPKTVLAIAIFETGWMECKKCSYQYNNLFGFRANHDYLRFESAGACIEYLKKWQETYYDPWKLKHPKGTYYEFLAHVKYAHINIASYLKTIRAIERLTAKNVKEINATALPSTTDFLRDIPIDTTTVK